MAAPFDSKRGPNRGAIPLATDCSSSREGNGCRDAADYFLETKVGDQISAAQGEAHVDVIHSPMTVESRRGGQAGERYASRTYRRTRGDGRLFHPFVPVTPPKREYATLESRRSTEFSAELIGQYDATLIATDHDAIDYALMAKVSKLLIDTRNACGSRGLVGDWIVKS